MTIFGASSLHPKIPFPAPLAERELGPRLKAVFQALHRNSSGIFSRRCGYSGLSLSASNCRLHSIGRSRRRSVPMPLGRRAFNGVRKASGVSNRDGAVFLIY